MPGISIVVTAWNNTNYLEECLDSIVKQDFKGEYEVLLGIDCCEKTRDKFLTLRDKNKYKNFKAYYMTENKGTYVTTNTLISFSKYDIILRFDSDDVMMPEMLSSIYTTFSTYNADLVKFKFLNFNEHRRWMGVPSAGVMAYTRELYYKVGGYKPWRCAADSDFLKRILAVGINVKTLNTPLFLRRSHSESLTNKIDTGFRSELRRGYNKIMAKGFEKIVPEINKADLL